VTIKQMMAELKAAMQAIVDKAKAEERDLTDEETAEIETKAAEYQELSEKLAKHLHSKELVKALAGGDDSERDDDDDDVESVAKSIGVAFVKSAAYQNFLKANPMGTVSGAPISIEAKDVGGLVALGIGDEALRDGSVRVLDSTLPGYEVDRRREFVNFLPHDHPLSFLNLIHVGRTRHAYSTYIAVIAESNNAAVVAEGDLKPLSDITTSEERGSKAVVVADGFDVTNQTLTDNRRLVRFMESRIRRHIWEKVEQLVLAGTGPDATGIFNTEGTLKQPFDTDIMTTLARAIERFQAVNGSVQPQAIVLNPADLWNLRLLREGGATLEADIKVPIEGQDVPIHIEVKDVGGTGPYLLGSPLQQGNPSPWGVRVVTSTVVPKGTAVLGRFDSISLLELGGLSVVAFNQHKDYAQRNMTYVRAEIRVRIEFTDPREIVIADISGDSALV